MRFFKEHIYLIILLVLAAILLFWNVGSVDVFEWDEARNGNNALEMYQNGDYINLYYNGSPDTWNAKPPLLIWMIVACYELFGFNEFALRLPTALSVLCFLLYFSKLLRLFEDKITVLLAGLILLSCKALVSWHIGLTGDFDALLLLFLTASAYHFLRFTSLGRLRDIYLTAVFTGLAFYTKGSAAVLFLPGFLLYALVSGKAKQVLRNMHTWFAAVLFILIAGSWVMLVLIYGLKTEESYYGSNNAIETMLVHDSFRRFTDSSFDGKGEHNPFYFFWIIDVRMNVWNYLFYLSLLTGAVVLYRKKALPFSYLRRHLNQLLLFSVCMILPIAILLTLARNPHDWYMAPIFGFVAYLTAKGLVYLCGQWSQMVYLVAGVFLFCFVRHFIYLHTLPRSLHHLFGEENPLLKDEKPFIILQTPGQHENLYLNWRKLEFILIDDMKALEQYKGYPIFYRTDGAAPAALQGRLAEKMEEGGYVMAKILK